MSDEKLPDGWVFHQTTDDGAGYADKKYRECHRAPCAEIHKHTDGFYGEYWRTRDTLTDSVIGTTLRSTALMLDALHENTELEQLRLHRNAAQLYDGDFAAALVGEDGAG